MNDPRAPRQGTEPRIADELAKDLRALSRTSERDRPQLDSIVRTVTRRPRTWEEYRMAFLRHLSHRPWIPASFAGAVAVLALLTVPFSYERTTGNQVTLTLTGGRLDPGHIQAIAGQLARQLHGSGVTVAAEDRNGAPSFAFSATVPRAAGIDAAAAASAFRRELARIGYAAEVRIEPVRERVTGTMAAYAADQIVQVSVDGKSADQIAAEIRQGLIAAGVNDPQVSVETGTANGHDTMKLKVQSQTISGATSAPEPQIVLTKGGAPLGGTNGLSVRIEKLRSSTGTTTMSLHVQDGAKTADIQVPNADTIGDAAIQSQIQSQLAAAGIQATVTVTNGQVTIEKNP